MISASPRVPWIVRCICALLALGLGAPVGPAAGQALLDFVTLDRIDYIRWADEPGRALTPADLGIEFATIGCSVGDDPRTCAYGLDAAAAFLPAGTRMYAVKGYATEFRLAAVWRDRIFLYQSWRNPRAKLGGDLYRIEGLVRAIDVRRGAPRAGAPDAVAIAAPADVAALVDMILRAPVRPPRPRAAGEPLYWLTLWLRDGTTLGRPFFLDTRELMGGVVMPDEFRRILDRHLGD